MKLLKLTVLPITLFASLIVLNSCESDAEQERTLDYSKNSIVMSGAQEQPANASTALGTLNVSYSKDTRTLVYSFNWSGLSGAVTGLRVQGLAPAGYAAPVVQTISTSNIVKCSASSTTACGSFSGTMQVDGFVVKEQDVINGNYYINIATAAYPNGEIRGQVKFQ